MPLCWLSLWFLLFSIFPVHSSVSFNVTIDDQVDKHATGPQVNYDPVDGWTPSPTGAKMTWHESNFNSGQADSMTPPTASVIFYGSAVYVYCFSSLPASTDMIFYINGTAVGRFAISSSEEVPTALDTNNILVFANTELPKGNHTLKIQNGSPMSSELPALGGLSLEGVDSQKLPATPSVVMLDRIVYTTDQGTKPSDNELSPSDSKTSKIKVLTGVLVTFCILFAILLVYLLYRVFAKKASNRKTGILPISKGQNNRTSAWGWLTCYLKSSSSKASVALSSRFRSEGGGGFTVLQNPLAPPGILAEAEPGMQQKSGTESRWALVMSWRDRTVREAEIPSLPPTSNAPTTVFSGPSLARSVVEPLRVQRPQQPQDRPETPRTQPRRMFAIMNG